MSSKPSKRHGIVRGLDSTLSSSTHEGRFGRMFRTLPKAHFPEDALLALSQKMVSEAGTQTPETANPPDDEENMGIAAGYTYFGQFIDHDLTFDPASSLQKIEDPDALIDFRTPRFDLDNIYGRGPDDQPYLYDDEGRKFILGRSLSGSTFDANVHDLPRNTPSLGEKRAIIGDPRNDENVIISQFQGLFLRFHNKMADLNPSKSFEEIQRLVRWHYQWVVVNDFLPTIINKSTVEGILPHIAKKSNIHAYPPIIKFYIPTNDPFIPVEFSVAAYRFGHSMIRPVYRLNSTLPDRFDIFSMDPNKSLTGFREFPSPWAIDWRLFFDFGNKPNPFSKERVQPSYKIDTSLVNPLSKLPDSIAKNPNNLALRNLKRGNSMGLPSGQDIARRMGISVILDKDLKVGKATEADNKSNPTLVSLHPAFKDKAPLWFYILAEAQQSFKKNDTPSQLGAVGGQIVGEVFMGLLMNDHHSFLFLDSKWSPMTALMKEGKFGITELITAAIS